MKGGGENPTEAAKLSGHEVGTAVKETQRSFASSCSFQSSAAGKAVPEAPAEWGEHLPWAEKGCSSQKRVIPGVHQCPEHVAWTRLTYALVTATFLWTKSAQGICRGQGLPLRTLSTLTSRVPCTCQNKACDVKQKALSVSMPNSFFFQSGYFCF